MLKMKPRVDLFFDVISPYSWLGFEGITRFRSPWDLDLRLRPMFLGGVMKATGNQPPGFLPAKAHYMRKDLVEMRRYWDVPLTLINDMDTMVEVLVTKGSLSAMRYLAALSQSRPELLEAAARELWQRRWNRQEDIHLPAHLLKVSEVIGLSKTEAADILRASTEKEAKDHLAANTKEAVESGAFGAPWFVVEGRDGAKHTFFGADRFHVIADVVGKTFPGPLREQSKL